MNSTMPTAISQEVESTTPVNGPGIQIVLMVLTIYSIIMIVIFLVGIIGNLLVIYVVGRFRCMQTVTNIHLLSLAMADTLYLLSMPFILYTINFESGFPFKKAFLCSVFWFLHTVNWFGGTFTLTAMSADRYLAILHPFQAQNFRTKKNTMGVIVLLWTVAIALMVPTFIRPQIMETELADNATSRSCTQEMAGKDIFTYYSFAFGYLIPGSLIIFFYSKVICRLRTLGPEKKSKDKRESQKKTTRLVLTIVLVYIFFWLPYWAFQIHSISTKVESYENRTGTNETTLSNEKFLNSTASEEMLPISYPHFYRILINYFCTALGFLNSALNPILYAFLSPNFRKSFWHLFTCGIHPRPVEVATNCGQHAKSMDINHAPGIISNVVTHNGSVHCDRNKLTMDCQVHHLAETEPSHKLMETLPDKRNIAEHKMDDVVQWNRNTSDKYHYLPLSKEEKFAGVMETAID